MVRTYKYTRKTSYREAFLPTVKFNCEKRLLLMRALCSFILYVSLWYARSIFFWLRRRLPFAFSLIFAVVSSFRFFLAFFPTRTQLTCRIISIIGKINLLIGIFIHHPFELNRFSSFGNDTSSGDGAQKQRIGNGTVLPVYFFKKKERLLWHMSKTKRKPKKVAMTMTTKLNDEKSHVTWHIFFWSLLGALDDNKNR